MHLRAWTINIALLNAGFLKMTNSSLSKQWTSIILVQAQIKQTWAKCERWKQKKWSKRMSLASSVYSFHVLQVILVKISPHKVLEQIDFLTCSLQATALWLHQCFSSSQLLLVSGSSPPFCFPVLTVSLVNSRCHLYLSWAHRKWTAAGSFQVWIM